MRTKVADLLQSALGVLEHEQAPAGDLSEAPNGSEERNPLAEAGGYREGQFANRSRRYPVIPPLRWLAPTALLLLVACAAPTGSLKIDISGLPTGQDATVSVTGPGSYGATVDESTTLTGLTPGTYTLQASEITTTAVTSEYRPTITPQSLDVIAGETATAQIAYTLRGGTLTIAISGLPAGLDADVNVAGPDGFTQDVSTSALLEVEPGEYTATADPVTSGGQSYTPTVTGSPVEVSSSTGSAMEVLYKLDPGSLQITIVGLPGGVDGNVLVEGMDGFSQAVSADATLTDLMPGFYRVRTMNARTEDPIVGAAYGARARELAVEVVSGATTSVHTGYELIPSSGRLWTPHTGPTVMSSFAAHDLVTTGNPPVTAIISSLPDFNEGIAFDAAGNAWVTANLGGSIRKFLAANLATDGSVAPKVTVGGLSGPVGLAFAPSGNLFVANTDNDTVVVFTPDQLLTDGSPSPSVTISSSAGSLARPTGLAFDTSGDLWVANFNGSVVRFAASDLASSGSPAPQVAIDDGAGGDLDGPIGLAFDASGDLWVASRETQAVLKFEEPGSLIGTVNPTPDVVLTGVPLPSGVAFDESGSLWVSSRFPVDLYRFDDPDDLSGAVSPAPDAEIDGASTVDAALIAFFPAALDLPITTP